MQNTVIVIKIVEMTMKTGNLGSTFWKKITQIVVAIVLHDKIVLHCWNFTCKTIVSAHTIVLHKHFRYNCSILLCKTIVSAHTIVLHKLSSQKCTNFPCKTTVSQKSSIKS